MEPRAYLRLEGLATFGVAVGGYVALDGPIWLFAALALAPDVSMLGYLVGPRIGGRTYNAVHTYTLPLLLGAVGVWADTRLALLVALVWIAHIGADRLWGSASSSSPGSRRRTSRVSPRRSPRSRSSRKPTDTGDRTGERSDRGGRRRRRVRGGEQTRAEAGDAPVLPGGRHERSARRYGRPGTPS